jgi:hypothetical protein
MHNRYIYRRTTVLVLVLTLVFGAANVTAEQTPTSVPLKANTMKLDTLPVSNSALKISEIELTTPEGNKTTFGQTAGPQYTLLVLVAPWQGLNTSLANKVCHYASSFYGRIKLVLTVCGLKRRIANNWISKLKDLRGTIMIDEQSSLPLALNTGVLPSVYLLDENLKVMGSSSWMNDSLFKRLAETPPAGIRKFIESQNIPISIQEPGHAIHSPWGSPSEEPARLLEIELSDKEIVK